MLFFGVAPNGHIFAYADAAGSELANELTLLSNLERQGVFWIIPLAEGDSDAVRRSQLLAELCRIHRVGWIDSKRLGKDGLVPCNAPQCGGYTLEAANWASPRMGMRTRTSSAGRSRDTVSQGLAGKLTAKPITLMTPEPTGGVYATNETR